MNEINIDGITYIKKGTEIETAEKYVICRTYSAGVFFGKIFSRTGREVTLLDARRIWRWDGAASLSELAELGTSKPNECKFPVSMREVLLLEAIEIIPCSFVAINSIKSVPVWTEHE